MVGAIEVDKVISATGQTPDIPDQLGLTIGDGNTIQVVSGTLATGRDGVFAGGDAVSGPASIIEAIASGRQAAVSIDSYLGGQHINITSRPRVGVSGPQDYPVQVKAVKL